MERGGPVLAADRACPVCGGTEVENYCTAVDRVLPRPDETWQIQRCCGCGLGWTSPMPADPGAYYPPSYLGNTRRTLDEFLSGRLQHSRSWRGEAEKARLVERICPGGRILDVGCGDGKFLWALETSRWDRTGVEYSRDTVELVRSRLPDLNLIAGDIYAPPLAAASFDVITFWHVLEHLPAPRRVIARAAALLQEGGWLVVSLPNLDSLQAALFRRHWYAFDDVPRHLYHFSRAALDRLLTSAGLRIQRHLLFSPRVNFHALKHSLLHWSEAGPGGRAFYYALKPILYLFPLLERLTGRYGILTVIARKPGP